MTDVNREEVGRREERLLAEYGDVPIEERSVEMPDERFASFLSDAREGYFGSGYAWVVRPAERSPELSPSMPEHMVESRDRALMILGRGSEEWGLPGGGVEAEETYEEAAVREVREETGIECSLSELFLLRRMEVTSAGTDERVGLLFAFFDARYEGGEISIQAAELNGAAWFAEPPERMRPANERRAAEWFDDADG